LLNQVPVSRLTFACLTEFVVHVNFQIRLGDVSNRNYYAAAGAVLKNDRVSVYSDNPSAKITLAFDCDTRLDFRCLTCKPLIIGQFVESALDTGRRNLKRVWRVDEIFNIQHGAEMVTHFGTILVSDSSRLINEQSDYRTAFRAGKFRVYQFEPKIDSSLFS
jgi:hypothetical protein